MKTTHYIGIDPGVHTGVCVWDRMSRKVSLIRTTDFFGAQEIVFRFDPNTTHILVEDPAMNRPTFGHDTAGAKMREKISQNVGSNKKEARLLIEALKRRGYTVQAIRPTSSKWDRAMLARLTGYTNPTSQHGRDAARLVVGF